MDATSDVFVTWLLFVGLLMSWSKALISVAIAILIRRTWLSAAVALLAGVIEGLVGSQLEMLDVYLTASGWQTIDALAVITMVLSALASLVWWGIARFIGMLFRRMTRGTAPA